MSKIRCPSITSVFISLFSFIANRLPFSFTLRKTSLTSSMVISSPGLKIFFAIFFSFFSRIFLHSFLRIFLVFFSKMSPRKFLKSSQKGRSSGSKSLSSSIPDDSIVSNLTGRAHLPSSSLTCIVTRSEM